MEEYENNLGICYEYQKIMLSTKSEEEFAQNKKKLIELSTNLSSSRGTFSPSYDPSGKDKSYHQKMLEKIKQMKAEAMNLLDWANKTTFKNRD